MCWSPGKPRKRTTYKHRVLKTLQYAATTFGNGEARCVQKDADMSVSGFSDGLTGCSEPNWLQFSQLWRRRLLNKLGDWSMSVCQIPRPGKPKVANDWPCDSAGIGHPLDPAYASKVDGMFGRKCLQRETFVQPGGFGRRRCRPFDKNYFHQVSSLSLQWRRPK